MLFNSINHNLKEAFYSIERVLCGNRNTPLEESEHERRDAVSRRASEASMTSGAFLDRARRGETLKPDKEENHEIVKEFVRTKSTTQNDIPALSKEVVAARVDDRSQDIPVMGLKGSLHATTDQPSFDKWKNLHAVLPETDTGELDSDEIQTPWEAGLEAMQKSSAEPEVVPRNWRNLSKQIALRLIDHPDTAAEVLKELAQHAETDVRSQVADNRNTSKEAIALLVNDESADVRMALAECYHLDVSILETLSEDENPYVSARAQTTLQRIAFSISPSNVSVMRARFGSDIREAHEVRELRARA